MNPLSTSWRRSRGRFAAAGPTRSVGDGPVHRVVARECRNPDGPDRSDGPHLGKFRATHRPTVNVGSRCVKYSAGDSRRKHHRNACRDRATARPPPDRAPRAGAPSKSRAATVRRSYQTLARYATATDSGPERNQQETACSDAESCRSPEKHIASRPARAARARRTLEENSRQEKEKDRAELMRKTVEPIGLKR